MRPTSVLYLNTGHPLFPAIDPYRADGVYVVVDPIDRSTLLYLSEQDYHRLLNVTLTQSTKLVVISRPEDKVFAALEEYKSSKK